VDFEYLNSEVNPAIANIVSPSEVVVVSTFHIELDGGGGDLHVTLPYSMLEPIREMLDAGFKSDVGDQDERWSKALREDILDVEVPLQSTVARRQLRVRDILHMQPGDVLPVELPEQMTLKANGVPTFEVKLGSHKDMLALQVMGPLERHRARIPLIRLRAVRPGGRSARQPRNSHAAQPPQRSRGTGRRRMGRRAGRG